MHAAHTVHAARAAAQREARPHSAQSMVMWREGGSRQGAVAQVGRKHAKSHTGFWKRWRLLDVVCQEGGEGGGLLERLMEKRFLGR